MRAWERLGAVERCSLLLAVGLDVFYQGTQDLRICGVVNAGAGTVIYGNKGVSPAYEMKGKDIFRSIACAQIQCDGAAVIAVASAKAATAPGKEISQIGLIIGGFQNVQNFADSIG